MLTYRTRCRPNRANFVENLANNGDMIARA